MHLYEIDQKIQEVAEKLESHLIETEGVIEDFHLDNELQTLQIERERKLLGIGCWIKNLNAEAEALKKEEQNLNSRRKALENKAENIKKWLSMNLRHEEKIKDSRCVLGWRKSSSLFCDLEDPVRDTPAEFVHEVVSYDIPKKPITDAIKSGKEVPGYTIKTNFNIQIK